MNQVKTTVRLRREGREATLEILRSVGATSVTTITAALKRIGIRALGTVEIMTPRHQVIRSKLVSVEGIPLDAAQVMQVLSIANAPSSTSTYANSYAA
jgi:hypothetical protein